MDVAKNVRLGTSVGEVGLRTSFMKFLVDDFYKTFSKYVHAGNRPKIAIFVKYLQISVIKIFSIFEPSVVVRLHQILL